MRVPLKGGSVIFGKGAVVNPREDGRATTKDTNDTKTDGRKRGKKTASKNDGRTHHTRRFLVICYLCESVRICGLTPLFRTLSCFVVWPLFHFLP